MDYKRALWKFHNGVGALLCNHCRAVISTGGEFKDVEHICERCARGQTPRPEFGMSKMDELYDQYQHLFAPCGYPTIGEGWADVLERALKRIDAARDGTVRISQVKEKFGGIRIYYSAKGLSQPAIDLIDDAILLAEARSFTTCEECGAEGWRCKSVGWLMTRCEEHARGDLDRSRPTMDVIKHDNGKQIRTKLRYDRERDAFDEVKE